MKLKKCSSEIWNVESGWVKGIHKRNSELKITVWLSTSIYQIFTMRCSRTFHRPRAFRITKTCEMNKSCSQTVLRQQEKWLNLSDKLSTINTSYLPCPSAFFIPWISPEVALVMRFFRFFFLNCCFERLCAISSTHVCPRAMEASKVLWDYIGWKFSRAQFLKRFRHSDMQVSTTGILKIKLAAIHADSFWWSKHQISLWQGRFWYSSMEMLKILPPMAMLGGVVYFSG